MKYKEIQYNGHAIMSDILGNGWTVYFEGEELWFPTVEKAQDFIDRTF